MVRLPRNRVPAAALIAVGLLGLLDVPAAVAQPAAPAEGDGLFVTVPDPITQPAVEQIKAKVRRAFERPGRRRAIQKIVFDFNPRGVAAGTSDYGPCITLKNYIQELRRTRQFKAGNEFREVGTYAFVHNEVTRHTVLPVLACAWVLMSPEGKLGDALRGHEGLVPEEVKVAYERLATRSDWGDLAYRMVDRELPITKVRTVRGPAFCGPATLKELKARGEGEAVEQPAGLEQGNALFDANFAFANGLARKVSGDREAVARELQMSRLSLREDWLAGRTPVAARIDLNGALDAGRLESLKRRISASLRGDVNLIILQLNSEGGETVDAASFAEYLRALKDASGNPATTVAYVPPGRRLGAATFLALGCSEIVMGDDSALGDFEYLKDRSDADLATPRRMLTDLARAQGYPERLFGATLKRGNELYRARPRAGGDFVLLTRQEKELDEARPKREQRWIALDRLVTAPDEFLKVDTRLAREFGVALKTDVSRVEDLYGDYGVDADRVRVSRDDWLERVAEFFREPLVQLLLILIGIAGLILELKMPGLGFPGVIAGVCFVLFFWSHSFVGQFTMLAVLLFVLGLVLIALEVFVMPGFGVTGVSGVVLIIASLVLVTLDKMPETGQDWVNLASTVGSFVLTMVAAIAVAFTLAWYLPHIPYANRLILPPPVEGEGAEPPGPAPLAAALLGAIGVAETPLRPAGKVRFGEDYLDVVSEGDYVSPGSRVQVVEIEGNRIVVKPV
jgi:membrane-bound ClpP family serine protease